ncbi:MAG: WG repeat-containing protein [Bacteroidales bacterium]|nr:WG repeat-containing protein [Bacteroidales bacterium]
MPEWALVAKDRLLGFIDKTGEEVVKPMYETIDGFKSASRK